MPVVYRQGEDFRGNWGCVWRSVQEGLEGMVVEHPLAHWDALDSYSPPDVDTKTERGNMDWEQARANTEAARAAGHLTGA